MKSKIINPLYMNKQTMVTASVLCPINKKEMVQLEILSTDKRNIPCWVDVDTRVCLPIKKV